LNDAAEKALWKSQGNFTQQNSIQVHSETMRHPEPANRVLPIRARYFTA
jgi:hypothetical protein